MKKILLPLIFILATPVMVFAQSKYVPLIDIPLLTQAGDASFSGYINFLYSLSIGIAALLAVIKIIVAGVKYMFSDVITNKSAAKGEIKGALLGLLLILGAYLILNTINPQLVNGTPSFKALPPKPDVQKRPAPVAVVNNTTNNTTNNTDSSTTQAPGQTSTPKTPGAVATKCNPTITSSVSGIYTVFKQNLTGCSAADQVTFRASLDGQCKAYGTIAAGSSTIRSCSVETSKI